MITHRRILLSEEASKHLLEAGDCWMIAGRSSHPEIAGRIVLHLVSIPKAQADAACEVALGIRKPGKRIITPPAPADALTAMSDGKEATANERDIHESSPINKST